MSSVDALLPNKLKLQIFVSLVYHQTSFFINYVPNANLPPTKLDWTIIKQPTISQTFVHSFYLVDKSINSYALAGGKVIDIFTGISY